MASPELPSVGPHEKLAALPGLRLVRGGRMPAPDKDEIEVRPDGRVSLEAAGGGNAVKIDPGAIVNGRRRQHGGIVRDLAELVAHVELVHVPKLGPRKDRARAVELYVLQAEAWRGGLQDLLEPCDFAFLECPELLMPHVEHRVGDGADPGDDDEPRGLASSQGDRGQQRWEKPERQPRLTAGDDVVSGDSIRKE